nr:immunoglobulin heavy chain junction region [Macaca mulatta]
CATTDYVHYDYW